MADYKRNNRNNAPRISVDTWLVRLGALSALLSALIFLAALPAALGQTWTGGGGNVNWNTAGNWNPGVPASGTGTSLIFGGTTNTGTLATPLNQNVAVPFILNTMTFNAGSAAFFLGGNALQFDGIANSITQSSSNTVSIANNFAFPTVNAISNILLTGSGTGVVTLSGTIVGGNGHRDYSITKTGTSTFVLSGVNTFDGAVAVNAGVLNIQNSFGLGSTTGATSVASGAALQLQGSISVPAESLSLNGSGIANDGALRNISGNNSYAGTITQASASRINSDSGILTLSAVNTSGFALTLGGAGNVTVSGVISGGAGSLIKNDAGTVTLSAANTFTGATTVNAGTLLLAPGAGSALASTSSVTVNSGGTLLLGASNQINNAAPMTLNGGTFAKGNFSEGSATTPGVGALTLTAAGSHIDFGTGTVGVLTFASFIPGAFSLAIDNWTGTIGTIGSGSTDRLIFASDQSANLSRFNFAGFGPGAIEFNLGGGFWEVVPGTPIPEPATWVIAALSAGAAGWYLLRRRQLPSMGLVRLAAVTTLLVPFISAQASDRHWDGSEDREWSRNNNWSNGGAPGKKDNAVFDGLFVNQPHLTTDETIGGIWMTGNFVQDVTISSDRAVLTLLGNNIGSIFNREPGLGLLVDNTNGTKLTIDADLSLGNSQTWRNASGNVVNIFGGVNLNNRALTIDGSGNFQVNGVISNFGFGVADSIALTGIGFRAFTGANTYDGPTIINGGTLFIQNDTALGSTDGGTSVTSGAQLSLVGGVSPLTISNEALTLNGAGNPNDPATGAGALRNVGGNNSFAGRITLGSNSTIICGGETLTLSGGIEIGGFTVTFGGDSNIVETGSISGTGALVKNDTGTLTLSGVNGYSGGSTINGGTVIITNSNSLGVFGGGATINDGTLEAAATITTSRNFVLGSANSRVTVDDTFTFTTTGVLSGTGTLNKNGNGTMVLGGANTYTGATHVNAGVLNIQTNAALGTTAGGTTVSSGAELQVQGGITVGPEALTLNGSGTAGGGALRNISGNNSFAGVITLGSGSAIKSDSGLLTLSGGIVNGGFTATFGGLSGINESGVISGTGAVTKNDGGSLTLSGSNSYLGSTTINAGTLQVDSNNGLGSAASGTIVANGAVLNLNNVNYSTAEPLTLNGTGISNSGALLNTGTSTFAGPINVASNATINAGGGTLNLTGGISKDGTTVTIAGGGTVNITTNGITGIAPNSDFVVDGTRVVLSATNSYNGPTTVQNSGILELGNNNVLPSAPQTAITLNTSSVFDLASFSDGVGSLSGDSSAVVKNRVVGGTSTLTVNPANGVSTTFAGIIAGTNGGTQGNMALQKTGAGTLVLTGANTFSGATTVSGGTLTLSASSGSALGATSSVTVNSGGTLLLGQSNQINDIASMTLAGGTFAKGDFSEGSASTPGIGALTLTASGAHIDFGSGTVGVLTFASLTPGAFILTIDNWTGTPEMLGSGSTDRLVFASDQSANLGNFNFVGFGPGAVEFDLGGGFWEITPTAVPEPATWLAAALALGVAGLYLGRGRRRESAHPASRNVLVVICCGIALLPTALFATPREDIVRAVGATTASEFSQAPPRQFLTAFTAVALRVESDDLPNYVVAAINLRPELLQNTVVVAVKIAAKNPEAKSQTLCSVVDAIVKAAIAAKPDAVVSIAEAAAYGLPPFRDCVVNAAIAAAPQLKEAIENAVGVNNIPHAFLTMSPTDNGLWFSPATINAANISQPSEVVSPEQPPSG